jgi:hypothetical protein
MGNLGMAAQLQCDATQAYDMYIESLALRRELGDKRGMALVLNNLAEVMLQQGDAAQAHAYYAECLDTSAGTLMTPFCAGICSCNCT